MINWFYFILYITHICEIDLIFFIYAFTDGNQGWPYKLAIIKNTEVNMGKKVHIYTDFCFSPFSIFDAFEIEWAEVIKWETEILVVKFTVDLGRILSSSISWKTNYLAFTISWNLEVHDFFFSWRCFHEGIDGQDLSSVTHITHFPEVCVLCSFFLCGVIQIVVGFLCIQHSVAQTFLPGSLQGIWKADR